MALNLKAAGILAVTLTASAGVVGTLEAAADPNFTESLLAAHNQYRAEVGVPPLQWSETLADSAQGWADTLAARNAFSHSEGSGYGENLWKGTTGAYSTPVKVNTCSI